MSRVEEIFSILKEGNPNPTTELKYTNDFTFLIAIVLSARATDKHVNKCTDIMFQDISSPYDVIKLQFDGLKPYIETIGLWRNKGKNIVAMSEILVEKYNGKTPETFDELIDLPGVGRKSANVFLNNFYGKNHIGVDTHVGRTAQRLNLTTHTNPHKIEADLLKIVPEKFLSNAHNWLVLHGRYVCKSQNPSCKKCKLQKFCHYYSEINS